MLTYGLYLCGTAVSRKIVSRLVQKHLPILSVNTMESSTIKEIKTLFKRLQKAKKQAELLSCEIKSITRELARAENGMLKFSKFSSGDGWNDQAETEEKINHIDQIMKRRTSSSSEEADASPPQKKSKYDFSENNGYVVVYTDGACENNGKPGAKAGIGVWFGNNHPLNVSKPVVGKATNNTAEIQACICALKIAKENGIEKLNIITDSQFTINAMTKWIYSWKKNNWKLSRGNQDVKNKKDFQELDQLRQGVDLKWQHVAGHAGITGNEEADKLAREGARLYKT
jgi:ribonuclease HI